MLEGILPVIDTKDATSGEKIIVAGPCSVESMEQIFDCADSVAQLGSVDILRAGIWKPRTSPGSFEGIGAPGLSWLKQAGVKNNIRVATEVGNANHVRLALSSGIDVLWIGARTSANPFAMQEISDAIASINPDVPVLVKNPVSPDLDLWIGALKRLYDNGIKRLAAVHRGFTSYGFTDYRNKPLWQIPIELHRRIPCLLILHDPSHTGGKREYVKPLSQMALDMGFNGLMIETHTKPDFALSDGGQQITPEELSQLLKNLKIRQAVSESRELDILRCKIDEVDSELLSLLQRRMELSREIGQFKKNAGMPVVQPQRYNRLLSLLISQAESRHLSPDFLKDILERIHIESVRQQLNIVNADFDHK